MNYCISCMLEIDQDATNCPFCGKKQNVEIPPHHLMPGTILKGRFLVGTALGEGGFGITYIGRDLQLDMRVAIKEFYPNGYVNRNNTVAPVVSIATYGEHRDFFEAGRERFLREARILARFSNEEGVVNVRDFFEENNTAYIVMEYLKGQTLKEYLKKTGTLTPEQTVSLLMPVMNSLKKIHGQGMIHRDISPDNIMLVDGKVKLLDFGAARNMSSAANKSLSVMLKPGYAPEEQYRTKGKQGPWTDIYALSATMYKCITGVTPDEAPDRYCCDELKVPSALGISIEPRIEAAIMKGLSVLGNDRYQTIEELINALNSKEQIVSSASAGNSPIDVRTGLGDNTTQNGSLNYSMSKSKDASDKSGKTEIQPQKKPGKGLIIGIAVGAAAVIVGFVLIFVFGGKKKEKGVNIPSSTDNTVSNSTTDPISTATGIADSSNDTITLSDILYDYTFQLEGVVYKLPMSFDKLASNGWVIDSAGYSDEFKVPGKKSVTYMMTRKNGRKVEVASYNPSGDARAIKDCYVCGVEVDMTHSGNILLPRGISCLSSVDEIVEAFGKPKDRSDESNYSILTYYMYDQINKIEFWIYSENSGMKKYSSISLYNIQGIEDEKTETKHKAPDFLADYTAPTALGTDLTSGIVSIGGDLYKLPAPVSQFLNKGWILEDNLGAFPAGYSENYIELKRGEMSISVCIKNMADYQTIPENCVVCSITMRDSDEVSLLLPCNIIVNETAKEEVEAAVTTNFHISDWSDSYTYDYSDSKRGLYIYIRVGKTTNKVDYIKLECNNWTY